VFFTVLMVSVLLQGMLSCCRCIWALVL